MYQSTTALTEYYFFQHWMCDVPNWTWEFTHCLTRARFVIKTKTCSQNWLQNWMILKWYLSPGGTSFHSTRVNPVFLCRGSLDWWKPNHICIHVMFHSNSNQFKFYFNWLKLQCHGTNHYHIKLNSDGLDSKELTHFPSVLLQLHSHKYVSWHWCTCTTSSHHFA